MRVRTRCPFCKLLIIRDDEARTVLHKSPVCSSFDALASKGNPEVREVDEQAVSAHLDALRARVQRLTREADPSRPDRRARK